MSHLLGRKRANEYYRSQGGNYDYSEEEQGAIVDEDENRSKGVNYRHNQKYSESREEKRRVNGKDHHNYFRRNYNSSMNERNHFNHSERTFENDEEKERSYNEDRKSSNLRNYNNFYGDRTSHHNQDDSITKERSRINESRKREVVKENSTTHNTDGTKHKSRENLVKKNTSFLIILPKNYMRFLNEEYERIYKDVIIFSNNR